MQVTLLRDGGRRRAARPKAPGVLVSLLLAAALLTACGGSSAKVGSSSSASGRTLRIGDSGDTIDSLNPFDAHAFVSYWVSRMIYPYLLQYNAAGSGIVGDFAQSVVTSNGGTTFTFHLYPGAHWTDGRPLTSADAAWTLRTIVRYASGPAAAFAGDVAGISSIQTPSPTSLVVTYRAPQATAEDALAQIPILPEHIWAKYATGNASGLTKFANTNPVGAGPFKISRFTAQPPQFLLLTRAPTYYGPKPNVGAIGYQGFSNTDALVNELNGGQLDAAFDLPATAVAPLRGNTTLEINSVPGSDVEFLGVDTSPNLAAHRELLDPVVREAIDMAINRPQLVSTVLLGQGTAGNSILGPALAQTWVDPSIQTTPYDPTKANMLLDGLGFKRGPGGVRVADGHPMRYNVNYLTGGVDPRALQIIQSDLQAIGIAVTPLGSDYPAFQSATEANNFAAGQLSIIDWSSEYDPAPQLSILTCGQLKAKNSFGYCTKTYDSLYAKQETAQTADIRHRLVDRMQEIVAQSRPILALWAANSISVQRRSETGISLVAPLVFPYESKLWLNG
jgi:peptide/nickel transport system substrate-binding protein